MSFRFAAPSFLAAVLLALPAASAETAPAGTTTGSITGVLTKAEDAGYPMYWLIIAPKGEAEREFLMNNEEAQVEGGSVEAMKGKTVEAAFTVSPSTIVIDVTAGGKSIAFPPDLGADERPAVEPEAKKEITGILSGAAEPTASDLPSQVTVTAKDGTAVTFDWYVDDVMAKQNGKEVTLTYAMETRTDVTAIKLAK